MRSCPAPRIGVTILGAAVLFALANGGGAAAVQHLRMDQVNQPARHGAAAYAGVWLSADDAVRLDLSADLTYERSVIGRTASAIGTYTIQGVVLVLRDANGLRTTVKPVGPQLEMAGYRLSRV